MSTTGEKLMKDFGFNKFRNDSVRVARVLGTPTPVYVVAYDSRRPTTALTQSRINNNSILNIYRGKETDRGPLLTAPYINLSDFNGNPSSYTFLLVDYAGSRLSRPEIRESKNYYSNFRLFRFYELTLNDFKTAGPDIVSGFTQDKIKQRRKTTGTAPKTIKLIQTEIDGDTPTFKFLVEATKDGEPKQQIDIESKSLSPNKSELYEIWLEFPNGLELLDLQDKETITRQDIVALLEAADVKFASSSPSFLYQGFQYWLTQLDSSIVPENRKPKRWNLIHGTDEVFLDKHTAELVNSIRFFEQQMASQLQSELRKQNRLPK